MNPNVVKGYVCYADADAVDFSAYVDLDGSERWDAYRFGMSACRWIFCNEYRIRDSFRRVSNHDHRHRVFHGWMFDKGAENQPFYRFF